MSVPTAFAFLFMGTGAVSLAYIALALQDLVTLIRNQPKGPKS